MYSFQYLELYRKAHEFANFAGYELIILSGYFKFYNNPVFSSFSFNVDPRTFSDNAPETLIIEEFNKR